MRIPVLVGKVHQWLGRHEVGPGCTVVAVSGGPDSVALLRILLTLQEKASRLVIAHLNHRLRGVESDADEEFVRQLHARLVTEANPALELRCERIEVAALARAAKTNLESMARKVRYEWLGRVARETQARWVATGHTADDQAETVLHRLLRGTGLKGLRGIAARREMAPGVEVVRPLLASTRAEVLAYLQEEGQSYRTDSSNLNPAFTRNRIRHELLPYLAENYNPAMAAVLCRLAEQAEEAYRAEQTMARALLAEAERPRAGALLVLDRQRLMAAPRHLVREVFRLLWDREGWPMGQMGFDAWDRLAAVVLDEGAALDLPGGIQARCRERVVQVGRPL